MYSKIHMKRILRMREKKVNILISYLFINRAKCILLLVIVLIIIF